MKRTGSANASSKSSAGGEFTRGGYGLCLNNTGFPAALDVGKVYRVLSPEKNDPQGSVRVVDESGEDYLYPAGRFVKIALPPRARRALASAIR